MQSPRLSRFKRDPSAAAMQVTDRDREILWLIRRYRFLRSTQIVALLGGSAQQTLRRLQLLFHHGYLERPRSQLDYYHQGGSRHIVYGIGSRGAGLLKQELEFASDQDDIGEKNRPVGGMFLRHELLVSDVMVALELACQKKGVHLLMDHELASGGRRPFRWTVKTATGVKISVEPDRVFALESKNANGETDRAFFFLEADRGTMPVMRKNLYQTSFYRKLLGYEATWSQSIHERRFGFHRFRVLTVTTSAARVKSLIEACATLKSGQGLFIFADLSILSDPSHILSPIWQTGRSGEKEGLMA